VSATSDFFPGERVSFDAAWRSMAEVEAAQSTSGGRNVNGGTQPAVTVTDGHDLVTSVDCHDSIGFDGDAKCSKTNGSWHAGRDPRARFAH